MMDAQALADLYDATSTAAWRLARCLAPDDDTAVETVRRAYAAIAASDGRVPAGRSKLAHVLAVVRRESVAVPPLLPAA